MGGGIKESLHDKYNCIYIQEIEVNFGYLIYFKHIFNAWNMKYIRQSQLFVSK